MTASGTDSSTTSYTYDAANHLLSSTTDNETRTYTYDDNGNLLTELDATNTAVVTHSYDGLNRLISSAMGSATITYSYNPQGIRTSRTVGTTTTQYVLDGGDVVGETAGDTTTTYLRGLNLVSDGTNYYLHNAHGDVTMLANASGTVTKSYSYDAFGNQLNTVTDDTNPFRYCGEYYDSETGNYYLRARYYDPTIGRFTQEDTHWNTANMIYGDTMQKLNVTVDAEGGEYFTAIPQLLAIRQAGNLYGYAANNPVAYIDPSGLDAIYVSHRKWGEGGLPIVGHAFLFFESGGNWYLTEFAGKKKRDAKIYLSDEWDKDDVDKYLNTLSDASIVYIKGDFSASLEIAQKYNGTNYGGYHFLKNNCLDYVQEVMWAGQISNTWIQQQVQTSTQIVPEFFAVETSTGISMRVWFKLLLLAAIDYFGGEYE